MGNYCCCPLFQNTPGVSPSSTEESNAKSQNQELVDDKNPVSTGADDKLAEEPQSNDTSYGVEATAVRKLAASTGTVAILGTTAKTQLQGKDSLPDDSQPETHQLSDDKTQLLEKSENSAEHTQNGKISNDNGISPVQKGGNATNDTNATENCTLGNQTEDSPPPEVLAYTHYKNSGSPISESVGNGHGHISTTGLPSSTKGETLVGTSEIKHHDSSSSSSASSGNEGASIANKIPIETPTTKLNDTTSLTISPTCGVPADSCSAGITSTSEESLLAIKYEHSSISVSASTGNGPTNNKFVGPSSTAIEEPIELTPMANAADPGSPVERLYTVKSLGNAINGTSVLISKNIAEFIDNDPADKTYTVHTSLTAEEMFVETPLTKSVGSLSSIERPPTARDSSGILEEISSLIETKTADKCDTGTFTLSTETNATDAPATNQEDFVENANPGGEPEDNLSPASRETVSCAPTKEPQSEESGGTLSNVKASSSNKETTFTGKAKKPSVSDGQALLHECPEDASPFSDERVRRYSATKLHAFSFQDSKVSQNDPIYAAMEETVITISEEKLEFCSPLLEKGSDHATLPITKGRQSCMEEITSLSFIADNSSTDNDSEDKFEDASVDRRISVEKLTDASSQMTPDIKTAEEFTSTDATNCGISTEVKSHTAYPLMDKINSDVMGEEHLRVSKCLVGIMTPPVNANESPETITTSPIQTNPSGSSSERQSVEDMIPTVVEDFKPSVLVEEETSSKKHSTVTPPTPIVLEVTELEAANTKPLEMYPRTEPTSSPPYENMGRQLTDETKEPSVEEQAIVSTETVERMEIPPRAEDIVKQVGDKNPADSIELIHAIHKLEENERSDFSLITTEKPETELGQKSPTESLTDDEGGQRHDIPKPLAVISPTNTTTVVLNASDTQIPTSMLHDTKVQINVESLSPEENTKPLSDPQINNFSQNEPKAVIAEECSVGNELIERFEPSVVLDDGIVQSNHYLDEGTENSESSLNDNSLLADETRSCETAIKEDNHVSASDPTVTESNANEFETGNPLDEQEVTKSISSERLRTNSVSIDSVSDFCNAETDRTLDRPAGSDDHEGTPLADGDGPAEFDEVGRLNNAATTIQSTFRGYRMRRHLDQEESGLPTSRLTDSVIENVTGEVDQICEEAIKATRSILQQPSPPSASTPTGPLLIEQHFTKQILGDSPCSLNENETYEEQVVVDDLPPPDMEALGTEEDGEPLPAPTLPQHHQSQAASKIQAGVRGYLTRKQVNSTKEKGVRADEDCVVGESTQLLAESSPVYLPPQNPHNHKGSADEGGEEVWVRIDKSDVPEEMAKRKRPDDDTDGEEAAAALIQSTYRGYKNRQQLKKAKSDTTEEENREERLQEESSEPNNPSHDESATIIQASVRGFLERKRQKARADAAVKIQAGFRGFKVRREMKQPQK